MTSFRKVIERLDNGSSALALHLARGVVEWLKAGSGAGDFVIRLGFLAVPLVLVWSFLVASRSIMWLLAAIWLIAAWRRVQPEAAVPSPQESSEPAKGDDAPKVLQALRESADPHAHLAIVAQRLGTDTAHVREVLSRAGVPISDVRMKGRGVSTGVKAADIPLPSPSPSPSPEGPGPVVGPGQANNNDTELTVSRFPSGVQIISVPDPENPARTHVRVIGPIES
ncbi:hypothetical protein ACFO9E_18255 [Streptomyces maoxianensis]|uniref:Uncharacterized protein n=1 Tax=Streptomyces maoxianensis TaxID=1459942 RepID=A0ABV9G9W0_9ACTN